MCLLISRVEDFGYKFQQLHQSMIMNKDSIKCVLQSSKNLSEPEGEVEWSEGSSGRMIVRTALEISNFRILTIKVMIDIELL